MPWLGIPATPPKEITLLKAGVNESDYGPITFDEKAAEMVLAADKAKGNPLYFDINHGMAVPKEQRTREQGEAAGSFKLAVRDGNLVAIDCEWNGAGAKSINERLYNLFSPFFAWESDENGVVRPTQVLNCALVNMAGLDHIEPIAAEADLKGDVTMNEAEIKALQDRVAKAEAEVVTLRGKTGVMALAAIVGVSDEAEVKGTVTALVKVRTDVLALTAQTEPAAALGVLKAWKKSHDDVGALTARETERETVALEAEFKGLLDKGVKELRIDAAPASVEKVRKFALAGYGGKVTKEAVAEFAAYLPTLHAKGVAAGGGGGPTQRKGGNEPLALSADQIEMLEKYRIPKEFGERALKQKERFIAHKAKELEGSEDGASASGAAAPQRTTHTSTRTRTNTMSLAAPAVLNGSKGPVALSFGRTTKAGKIFYARALVMLEPVGKFLIPAAGTTSGGIVCGRVELDNHPSVDTTAGVDGDTTIDVKCGVFPFNIGSSADALAKADEGNDVYVIDDQTVGKTDGAVGRPIAGQLFLIGDANGNANPTGAVAWVSVGGPRLPNSTQAAGKGSTENITGAGALSVATEISTLTLPTGATALTLANGTFKGQRKVVTVIGITGSPNATITPTTTSGFTTVSALGALGDCVEFEWTGAAWIIVANAGVTVA